MNLLPLLSARWTWRISGSQLAALVALSAILFFRMPLSQAQQTASISGVVRDTYDALVPGSTVKLTDEASNATRSETSNGEGFFSFLAVQPATYTIQVQMKNFETWRVTGIEVHPGDHLTVPKIRLVIGKITQEVTVSATAAGVALDSPEHSSLITSEDIQRLSTTGRDVSELISILPGFTLNAGTGVQNQGPDYTTTSFGTGNLGAYGANGSAPQQGLVNLVSDGANIIDPGDMGGQLANVNMDQVQEVKVQTSNFGADEAKGPIVINAVGKSGGAAYHGSLYTYARNAALNSNDWLSDYENVSKAQAKYLYPGGTLGGPVRIPWTHFNRNKHTTFWVGLEDYRQTNNALGSFGGPLFAFVPTPAMLAGDFSDQSIGAAFNVPYQDLPTNCSASYAQSAAYSIIGGNCFSPAGQVDDYGRPVSASGQIDPRSLNPAMAAFTKYYPAINRVPQASNGYASDGYTYAKNVLATNNGFQFHGRADQNFSDSLKFYATYNWEKVNSESPLNNLYYNPPNTIPYPTPLYSNGYSHYLTLDLTKVINPSMTNELIASGVYFNQPQQFGNRALALDTGTPWAAAGYSGGALKNGINQLPRIYSWETIGIPDFSFGNVPGSSLFLRKSSWNVTDSATKTFHTHTFKFGVYAEQTRNNNVVLGSDANGTITFDRYEGCLPNEQTPVQDPSKLTVASLGNTTANFLTGCTGGYSQSSADPSVDLYFNSFEFYATDEWKIAPRLTLTAGIRFSHFVPWTDAHGNGAAIWDPSKVTPGVRTSGMTQDATTWPGISWHKLDPSIPVAGMPTRALFYAPRVGIAYDMYGNGKTVFRGGWGAYRSRDSAAVAGGVGTALNLVDHTIASTFQDSCTLDQLFNAAPVTVPPTSPTGSQVLGCGYYTGQPAFSGSAGTGIAGNVSVYAQNPKDDEQAVTYNYNFTLDQQLPRGVNFEVAYVGNQSTHLLTLGNLQNQNVIPLGAFFKPDPLTGQTNVAGNISGDLASDYRPYPNYQQINVPDHTNWANYNALQASITKQRGSLVFGVNYTWSKAMGVRGNYDTGNIGDPLNPNHDYGILSFDRPQQINFTYSYQEGKLFKGRRELGWILNGWELSGITSVQSGPDLSILNGSTNFGFSAGASYYTDATRTTSISIPANASTWLGSSDYTLQPIVTCDPRLNLHSAILTAPLVSRQYANGNCFGLPAQGTQGWWNLPDVHGPAYSKSDLSVYKDIKITERQNVQFRLAGFNFLNHPIPSFTNNNLNALNLTFSDGTCNSSTGAGNCYYSQQQAFAGLTLQNAGFGYTPYKWGVRIVELGLKYNF